jgi:hypothetical protein
VTFVSHSFLGLSLSSSESLEFISLKLATILKRPTTAEQQTHIVFFARLQKGTSAGPKKSFRFPSPS